VVISTVMHAGNVNVYICKYFAVSEISFYVIFLYTTSGFNIIDSLVQQVSLIQHSSLFNK